MASTIIHLAIAKKVNEKIKTDNLKDYYLGAIAPDLSKQVGETKEESHFLINTKGDTPNIDLFVKRYPMFKYNSFDLGYFVHLYTDKEWTAEFLPSLMDNDSLKLVNGTTIKSTPEEMNKMIYSDYTNLNVQLIDKYQLDLSIFYEDFIVPDTRLKEIPVEKLDILLNKIGLIIENSKIEKTYTLDITSVSKFIDKTADKIIREIEKY